jgi:hypothetical protein
VTRVRQPLLSLLFNTEALSPTGVTLQRREMTVKRTSKWGSFCERVVKLQDGESIVLEREGDAGRSNAEGPGLLASLVHDFPKLGLSLVPSFSEYILPHQLVIGATLSR